MVKISLRYNSTDKITWIRINKKSISEEDLEKLYKNNYLHLWKINKINYVFTFRGTVGEAENKLKHLIFNNEV